MANDKKRANDGKGSSPKKAKLMAGLDIEAVMSAEGPVVKCVLLKQAGEKTEIDVDFTPSKQAVQALLGGDHTFVGQYEDLNVMIMCNPEHQEDDSGVALTTHKLQPPFHGRLGQIKGDILLFRCDDNGDHKDFTLEEYEAFLKLEIPEWEPPSDEEESDEDEEDEEGYRKAAVDFFIQEFKDANEGREPNEEELKEIETRVANEMANQDDPAQAALDYLVEEFEEEHGRKPNEDEMAELEKEAAERVAAIGGLDQEGMDELINGLFEAACARFKQENGEDPDEDAQEQILRAVVDAAKEQFGGDDDDEETEDDEEEGTGDDDEEGTGDDDEGATEDDDVEA
ncbi:hypothetical protein SPRG_05394 [Saprolegnia parasitica CBS 223.65]|uniref:DUF5880 domain-containing protein n=1 Tax=Saprolegnia parasitica (strain CBS 223.65) TaxID=695850 RepID=A0A067CRK9_SAPPC|nr:hypothetical protein SPRG_05394 [Saprolegnia parasitica CBS 223.65]KDO29151.1 hypothetical protein SPRG_05394 [Saprolegnia parasitica CBS 223.65]|eukprot:XP_012200031.1 hypothetical protein SPRG_05394 [Saprolegnia parasitica CBS 223.65]